MERKRFLLLDIDYVTENDEAVIRLFGKIKGDGENKSIIAKDKSFKPYIYVYPHEIKECMEELGELNLKKIEKVRKKDVGIYKEFLKITLKHPQEVPKLREKIWSMDTVVEVREHDIPFYRRYLIDKGLFPMQEVEVQGTSMESSFSSPEDPCIFEIDGEPLPISTGLPEIKVLSFDIEACNPKGMPQVKQDPIIMISLSSNQGFKKVYSTKPSKNDFVEELSSEKELLQKFVDVVKNENPDLITGYNTDIFDFPYIRDRAARLGVTLDLGVDGSELKFMRRGFANSAVIKGRIHVDLYPSMRRFLQLDRYTLERVYLEIFEKEKKDINGDEIHSCWADGGERLEELFEYSLDDAVAVTKIGEEMLPLSMAITGLVGQPLFDISRMATGQQVEWYLIRKAYEYGDIVPNKPSAAKVANRRRIEGGYVKEPVLGLHKNVVYFDFRSLYPSIIISRNVSPDTLVDECDEENCYTAPEVGSKFLKEPVGFVPSVIGNVLNERVKIKSRMKEATDPRERHVLDVQQEALKRVANTMYGVYGFIRFRWYCLECADSITAWGREFIKNTMKESEKSGFKPIYADTDGFYATYVG
jgi:DNA polymerase I